MSKNVYLRLLSIWKSFCFSLNLMKPGRVSISYNNFFCWLNDQYREIKTAKLFCNAVDGDDYLHYTFSCKQRQTSEFRNKGNIIRYIKGTESWDGLKNLLTCMDRFRPKGSRQVLKFFSAPDSDKKYFYIFLAVMRISSDCTAWLSPTHTFGQIFLASYWPRQQVLAPHWLAEFAKFYADIEQSYACDY